MATRAADLSWDETLDRPAQIMARDTVKPVLIRAGSSWHQESFSIGK